MKTDRNYPVWVIGIFIVGAFIALFLLSGCMTTTKIWLGDEQIATIESRSDALVEVEKDGTKIKVDNRGNKNILDSAIDYVIIKGMNKESN